MGAGIKLAYNAYSFYTSLGEGNSPQHVYIKLELLDGEKKLGTEWEDKVIEFLKEEKYLNMSFTVGDERKLFISVFPTFENDELMNFSIAVGIGLWIL